VFGITNRVFKVISDSKILFGRKGLTQVILNLFPEGGPNSGNGQGQEL